MDGQYYDLGKDFANFKRTIDGSFEQVKAKYEKSIGDKLNGKRVRARASRGYKQYVKDYEFDVTKITLDDYYDNYVVVAHDNTTPKPKEFFLKPGFKITILGPATGQPSPQKGGNPETSQTPRANGTPPVQKVHPDNAQSQPMTPAPAGNTDSDRAMDEEQTAPKGQYDAYPVEDIVDDIKQWLPKFLIKPETPMREFIKSLGWQTKTEQGNNIALFDLKLPIHTLKTKPSTEIMTNILNRMWKSDTVYTLSNMEFDKPSGEWHIRIKKTTANTKSV